MPYYNDTTCPFCGNNFNLVYLCEDCHEAICEECLINRPVDSLICVECGGQEINSNKHGQYFCKKCNSMHIRTIKKPTPTCPNCEGHAIVKISDRQTEILNRFKETILNARSFLQPLETMYNTLMNLRQTLIHLREDTPKCFHFTNLESEILVVFKLFVAAKNNVHGQVSEFFQDVQRNIQYVTDIYATTPANLPTIDNIVKNIAKEQGKVTKIATDTIDPVNGRILLLQEKISFMENTQNLFKSYLGKLSLANDEKIVFGLNCKLSEAINTAGEYNAKNGTILLTNRKLYFFHQQGLFKKKSILLFSVDLNDLQQVGVKGRLKKEVSLEFLNSMYKFSLTKDNRDKLIEWIDRARNFDATAVIDQESVKKLDKYKVNLKLFYEELENAIYQLLGVGNLGNMFVNQDKPTSVNTSFSSKSEQSDPFGPSTFQGQPAHPVTNNSQNPHPVTTNNHKSIPNPLQRFMDDHGHVGYPHDHPYPQQPEYPYPDSDEPNPYPNDPYPIPNRNPRPSPNTDRFPNPIPVRQPQNPRYPPNRPSPQNPGFPYSPQFPSPTPFQPTRPSTDFGPAADEYDPTFDVPNPSFNPRGNSSQKSGFSQNPFQPNQEMQLRTEIQQSRQEEFGLQQVIKALEQRFDNGLMNYVEFIKSYKEMQKQLYIVQEKIRQMEVFLHDNYEMFNN